MNSTNKVESKQNQPVSSWSLSHLNNVGHALSETAARMPDAIAVAAPNKKVSRKSGKVVYDQVSFRDLEAHSNQIANGFQGLGVEAGTRLALMVPPGIEFVAYVFGLFKAGAVIILIDPGMGRKNMVQCLSEAEPQGMIGISLAHTARLVFRHRFPKCNTNVVVGKKYWPGCHSAERFRSLSSKFEPLQTSRENEAAVIFTTGSTGPPKGVLYRHRTFLEQAEQIRDYFEIEPGSTDVSGFPLFALFNAAMGTTTVFPEMDATRPAEVHPPNIISAVNEFAANQSFGSPALWNTVSSYCETNDIRLPTIKRILSAGAPVPANVLQRIKKIIATDGEAFTPYGATESLPVACNSASVVLNETAQKTIQGAGTCVGCRFPKMNWKVIRISDEPIDDIANTEELAHGEIGELIVKGVVVTDRYVTRTEANAQHKIKDDDSFWHRMGDVGYLDDKDRFWFCGRKGHRVQTENETIFTIPCEAIINTHPDIYRSALVGVGTAGHETPVLIAEPWKGKWPSDESKLLNEIHELAAGNEKTQSIQHFLLHKSLPVDIRHNSKIFREQLRAWAAKRI